jgi:hypothetical protein
MIPMGNAVMAQSPKDEALRPALPTLTVLLTPARRRPSHAIGQAKRVGEQWKEGRSKSAHVSTGTPLLDTGAAVVRVCVCVWLLTGC